MPLKVNVRLLTQMISRHSVDQSSKKINSLRPKSLECVIEILFFYDAVSISRIEGQ